MSTSSATHRTYSFGEFTLDVDRGALRSAGADIKLRPKSFEVLSYLVERHGRLVSRDELLDAIWTHTVVTEDAVTQCLIDVRRAIGDQSQKMIRTVPRRGYIFDLPVTEHGGPAATSDAPTRTAFASRQLRWRLGVSLVVILGVAAVWLYLVPRNHVLEEAPSKTAEELTQNAILPEGRIMLAVLPLDNLSSDPEQEYFSDGLTEEMIAQLARLQRHRLGVIARTSVMYYKDKNKRIDQIARELNVDYVLEGSVRRTGNRVRITAQLIKASDQTHLWTQSFERDVDDIFALQIEIAERTMRSLALELLPAERAQLQRTSPVNSAAYEAYLKGRYHESRGGRNGNLKAIEHYHEAILEDPDYALAYAAVGHAYGVRGMIGYIPFSEGNSKFWDYNLKAAEVNPSLAEVEVNFADFKFDGDWSWSDGETGFRRAFEKDPDSESVVWHYALCLHLLGRYEEASGVLERALHLDPFSRQLNSTLIEVYLDSRQYDRAIEQYQRMIEWEPSDAGIYSSYGNALADMGRDCSGQQIPDTLLRRFS